MKTKTSELEKENIAFILQDIVKFSQLVPNKMRTSMGYRLVGLPVNVPFRYLCDL